MIERRVRAQAGSSLGVNHRGWDRGNRPPRPLAPPRRHKAPSSAVQPGPPVRPPPGTEAGSSRGETGARAEGRGASGLPTRLRPHSPGCCPAARPPRRPTGARTVPCRRRARDPSAVPGPSATSSARPTGFRKRETAGRGRCP